MPPVRIPLAIPSLSLPSFTAKPPLLLTLTRPQLTHQLSGQSSETRRDERER